MLKEKIVIDHGLGIVMKKPVLFDQHMHCATKHIYRVVQELATS